MVPVVIKNVAAAGKYYSIKEEEKKEDKIKRVRQIDYAAFDDYCFLTTLGWRVKQTDRQKKGKRAVNKQFFFYFALYLKGSSKKISQKCHFCEGSGKKYMIFGVSRRIFIIEFTN